MGPRSPLARGLIGFVVLFIAWQAATSLHLVTPVALASPEAVWSALAAGFADRTLPVNIAVSLGRLLLSVAVAGTLGIALGIAVGISRTLATFLEPLAAFFNAISGIIWLPLAVVWFGLSWKMLLFVIANSVFFIVFFNTLVGIRSVPRVYEQAVFTLGASRWRTIVDVLVPAALPGIIGGLRLGMGFGWRALIAAELVGATQGLGFMIYSAAQYLRTDVILAGILIIGVIAYALDAFLLGPLERTTVERWGLYQ
jgi:NitT/TauT family transport system permease protein/taurine transport system permease protein